MKVTYESLPKKFEEIKQHLTPGTIDAVQATLPIWEFYDDAEFKPSIDDVIELVNNELPDDEPAPAPKPEPKEEKPKAKPKAEEKPEYKFKYKPGDKLLYQYNKNDIWPILIKRTGEYDYPTPNQPSYFCEKIGSRVGGEFVVGAEELEKKITGKYEEPTAEEKPKKEEKTKKEAKPKATKKPKPKFEVGDRVVSIATGEAGTVESIRWIDQTTITNEKSAFVGWAYTVQFDNGVNSDEHGDQIKKEPKPKAEKPKKEPKTKQPKEKKEPEGEPVAKISPEIAIIARFVKLTKKGDSEEARKTLAALQKHIVNKEIRKTSQYAKEIMDIQKALVAIVYKKQKPTFSETEFERLEKISHAERQEPIAQLSRSFIMLIGKSGVKEKAKSLLEKFEAVDSSDSLVAEMVQALHDYIDGNTETIEPKQRSLQGIFGLAGI